MSEKTFSAGPIMRVMVLGFCCVFSCVPDLAYAETKPSASFGMQGLEESLYFSDIPSIVTATRLNQSVASAPVAATVIDRDMIEASGFTEVVDLLRLVPGYQVAHAEGNIFAATYHGHGWEYPSRLQILVNGRSIYLSMLSTVDWDYIGVHMEDIERIEVIRGPNAPAYGANAFSGAVNIITREPYLDQSSASVQVGSNDQLEQVVRYAGGKGDVSFRATAFSRKSDGFDNRNDHRSIKGFNFHTVAQASSDDELELELGYANGEAGALGEKILVPLPEPHLEDRPFNPFRERDIISHYQNIHWRHTFDKYNDFNVQLYHNYFSEKDSYTSGVPLSGLLPLFGIPIEQFTAATGEPDQYIELGIFNGISERYDLDVQHTWISEKQTQISWGGGIRQDSLRDSDSAMSDETLRENSWRFFVNSVLPITSYTDLNLGVILENNHVVEQKISPRIALNQYLGDLHSLRFSYSQAYRVPSLMEANINTQTRLTSGYVLDQRHIADPSLGPEKISAYDLGYLGKMRSLPISWEVKLYHESVGNLISTRLEAFNDFNNGVRKWINAGENENTGIEGQLTYRPRAKDFLIFQFGHAKSIANYLSDTSPWNTRTTRLGIPRNSFSLLGLHELDSRWQFSIGLYFTGRMEWESAGEIVDGYTRSDFRVSRDFKLRSSAKVKVAVGVQNLDNEYNDFNTKIKTLPHYYLKISVVEF